MRLPWLPVLVLWCFWQYSAMCDQSVTEDMTIACNCGLLRPPTCSSHAGKVAHTCPLYVRCLAGCFAAHCSDSRAVKSWSTQGAGLAHCKRCQIGRYMQQDTLCASLECNRRKQQTLPALLGPRWSPPDAAGGDSSNISVQALRCKCQEALTVQESHGWRSTRAICRYCLRKSPAIYTEPTGAQNRKLS